MVKVKTQNAIVAGHPIGTVIDVSKKNADYLVAKGFAEIVEEKKAEESKPKAKAESAPTDASKSAEKPKPQRKTTKDKNEFK